VRLTQIYLELVLKLLRSNWAIWENGVYDLTDYFYTISLDPDRKDILAYMNESVTDLFQQQPGQDITLPLNEVFAGMNNLTAEQHIDCLKNVFYVGNTDFRKTARCQVQNGLLLGFSVMLVTTIAAKCQFCIDICFFPTDKLP
jgi:chitin synthase